MFLCRWLLDISQEFSGHVDCVLEPGGEAVVCDQTLS